MAPDEEDVTEVDDEDLYDAAIEPDPKPEAEVKEDRARDERGRYAAKEDVTEEVATPPVAEAQPELPKEEKADHRIPLTELLNEREKRQSESRRAEQLARELETLRQQLQPPKQQQPIPDQFANPDQYNEYWMQQNEQLQQSVEQRLKSQEANFSLRLAHMQHKDVFEKAYQALIEQAESGNRGPAQAVANSPDPGQAMVTWYQREQVLAEVGTDPAAYRAKVMEELLKDPKLIAKALENGKAMASTAPTQIKLPPSLNKATSAGRSDDTSDMSDRALYQHSIGR
jgi:hypothetical protein